MILQRFSLTLSLLLLASLLVCGCGGSDFDDSSTASPTTEGAPSAGAAAVAQASFTFTGTSNANATPFTASSASLVQAGFRPNPTQRTGFFLFIQNGPATEASRFVRIDILDSPAKLEAGSRFSADSSRSGPRAQVIYTDRPDATPSSARIFRSSGGEVVITQLTASSVTVDLSNVQLAANPGAATGRLTITGQASVSF